MAIVLLFFDLCFTPINFFKKFITIHHQWVNESAKLISNQQNYWRINQ